MGIFIPCIDADIYINDDGSMDCPWLVPYYGDMTQEEYKAAGTALSVRRGCEYCYKMLGWKTWMKEEGWTDKRTVCHAAHPDWPGEWVSVNEILDHTGALVGYEVQWELYKSLHDVQQAGWKLHFSYFNAGEDILRREAEELAKRTYYTKCGRQFEKSSTADVTGYAIDENDPKCANCPFQVDVKEGWPPVHKRWECRAGSQPPNQENSWLGSVEDKCTLQVLSLHNDFLESVLEYCKDQPDLSAGYNQDRSDCRRSISVSCSQNKKGIAAKKALVEKFFPAVEAVPDERFENEEDGYYCESCIHSEYYGDVMFLTCAEGEKKKRVPKKHAACHNYAPADVIDDESECDLEEQLDELLKDGDKASCKQDDCPFNDREGSCLFADEDPQSDGYNRDVIGAVDGYGCKKFDVQQAYKAITNVDFTDNTIDAQEEDNRSCANCNWNCVGECIATPSKICGENITDPEMNICEFYLNMKCSDEEAERAEASWAIEERKKKPRSGSCGCQEMREDCPCFCPHNDGCSVLLATGNALKTMVNSLNASKINCDVFRQVSDRITRKYANEEPKTDIKSLETVNESVKIVPFDYSSVDDETAEFLQEKETAITKIKMMSAYAIGKELKEAQDKLANNKSGTFGAWVSSIGLSHQTAYNYINGYEFIVKNFDNIEDAEKLSPSLLFAVSKPSAPAELQEQVLSGDITTHKQYKELEEKLKAAEQNLENQRMYAEINYKACKKEEDKANKLKKEVERMKSDISQNSQTIQSLQQQLDQAKRNGDPAKVRELGEKIGEYQKQIEDLKRQLKEKPIEVPAVEEKEVIPDEVAIAIYDKVCGLYEGLAKLTDKEIQVFAEQINPDYSDDIRETIYRAINALNTIESLTYEVN